MWIDTIATILIAAGSFVTFLLAVVGSVRWVVRREMQPVRSEVGSLANRFETWTDEHHQRHGDERRAVAAAFKRSGLYPPDGWNGRNQEHGGFDGG